MDPPPTQAMSSMTPTSEYDREYYGDRLRNVSYTFIFLVSFVIGVRLYARALSKSRYGWDDTLIVAAAILCIVICSLALWGIHIGSFGYHMRVIRLDVAASAYKIRLGIEWLYIITITCAKVSILAFLLRVFHLKWFTRTVYLLVSIICSLCVADIIVTIFQCKPIAYTWDKNIQNGSCLNILRYLGFIMILNIVTDVAMLSVPLPIIWKLKTSIAQKMGLTIIFLTGSVGTVTSCIRMSLFFDKGFKTDPSWNAVIFISWSIIEPGVYILAACFPSYRIFFSHFPLLARVSNAFKDWSRSYGSSSGFCKNSDRNRFRSLDGWRPSAGKSQSDTETLSREREDIPINAVRVKCGNNWTEAV